MLFSRKYLAVSHCKPHHVLKLFLFSWSMAFFQPTESWQGSSPICLSPLQSKMERWNALQMWNMHAHHMEQLSGKPASCHSHHRSMSVAHVQKWWPLGVVLLCWAWGDGMCLQRRRRTEFCVILVLLAMAALQETLELVVHWTEWGLW